MERLYCPSQLTHTLQVLEKLEDAGITDREFLATMLIHDVGKLAAMKGEKWENIEGGGKIPLGQNVPGSGLANCTFNWDHGDIVHAASSPMSLRHAVDDTMAFHSAALHTADGCA